MVAEKFHTASGRSLEVAALWTLFKEFEQRPEPLVQAVLDMLMEPALSMATARERVRQRQIDNEVPALVWAQLNDLQRALVVHVLTLSGEKLLGKEARAALAKTLGEPEVTASAFQGALKVLERHGVHRIGDRLNFDSPVLERWVRALLPPA